jgi:hypothetical protein
MISIFASVKDCAALHANSGDLFGYRIADSILGENAYRKLDASKKPL